MSNWIVPSFPPHPRRQPAARWLSASLLALTLPLAMSASRINSFDANFPVPTSRRDANSRSAIFNFAGLSAMGKDKRIHEHARMSL